MKDEDVVRKFAAIIGVGRIYKHRTGAAYWRWQTANRRDTLHAVGLLYPFMCSRRQKQMHEMVRKMFIPKANRWDKHRELLKW